ncbi:hypothetical protein [Halalkalicoccus salilacus]|uniref:hypothetical protein n=1 Tax=Halalkalicoccus salilacus TaxID=3117459 RepID=UPI00300E9251
MSSTINSNIERYGFNDSETFLENINARFPAKQVILACDTVDNLHNAIREGKHTIKDWARILAYINHSPVDEPGGFQ